MRRAAPMLALVFAIAACAGNDAAAPTPPADAIAFSQALTENTGAGFNRFIEQYPESRYATMALELFTEASFAGQAATASSIEGARQALAATLRRDGIDPSLLSSPVAGAAQ